LVHPHACGELLDIEDEDSTTGGSSPRMWGTQSMRRTSRLRCRFIPTHVGNSSDRGVWGVWRVVHPHACGELPTGSVPVGALAWFIPTHVGNSPVRTCAPARIPVHPHACGELGWFCMSIHRLHGSSPRMWGTPLAIRLRLRNKWFIPTHVGNSS